MDQPSDENMITPRSQSAGQLGPYDGHGKRGRNFIARIKGCPESSASSQDEDEITNDRVSLDQRDGSTNGELTYAEHFNSLKTLFGDFTNTFKKFL